MMRVPASRWPQFFAMSCVFSAMLWVLLGAFTGARADVKHLQSDESTEIAYLIRRGTADRDHAARGRPADACDWCAGGRGHSRLQAARLCLPFGRIRGGGPARRVR